MSRHNGEDSGISVIVVLWVYFFILLVVLMLVVVTKAGAQDTETPTPSNTPSFTPTYTRSNTPIISRTPSATVHNAVQCTDQELQNPSGNVVTSPRFNIYIANYGDSYVYPVYMALDWNGYHSNNPSQTIYLNVNYAGQNLVPNGVNSGYVLTWSGVSSPHIGKNERVMLRFAWVNVDNNWPGDMGVLGLQVRLSNGCDLFYGILPTPTGTPSNLMVGTPTLLSTKDYTCPGIMPSGWGTVTPSGDWVRGCGVCMQSMTPYFSWTPWPSFTYQPTRSSTSGPTTSPTVSSTPTVTSTPSRTYVVPSDTIHLTFSGGSLYGNSHSIGSVTCTNQDGQYSTSDISGYDINCRGRWGQVKDSGSTIGIQLNFTARKTSAGGLLPVVIDASYSRPDGSMVINDSGHYEVNLVNSPPDARWGSATTTGSQVVVDVVYHISVVDYGHVPSATPTWGVVNSYCSSVDAKEQSDQDAVLSMLPSIKLGDKQCSVLPLTWIKSIVSAWTNVTDLKLCTQTITLGSVSILGVSTDMDLLLGLAIGIALLFIILRS